MATYRRILAPVGSETSAQAASPWLVDALPIAEIAWYAPAMANNSDTRKYGRRDQLDQFGVPAYPQ